MMVLGQALISYTYDNANRLTQITQGTSIVQFGYDAANRRTSFTLPNGVLVEYGYDAASRVTSITYKQNGTTVLGDLTYEYDKNGNRTKTGGSFARTGIPQTVSSTAYNSANQQVTFGEQTLTYDDNGNLTSITDASGTTLYSWNARNQLAGISGPSVDASFVYDALGRREAKTINGSSTEFLYDRINPVQETSGATVLANMITGLGLDAFLARTDVAAGTTSYFLPDALGSAIALTDPTGSVQTEYIYEPFGRTTATGAPDSNPFQYTGRENDGTGLYYYRARYYQPGLQRFTSEDPIELAGGDYNLYAYVTNNPTDRVDPFGLQAECPPKRDCLKEYYDCLSNCLAPGLNPSSLAALLGEAWGTYDWGMAWAHAASRGLTYPLKSSIFRGWMWGARNWGPLGGLVGLNWCIYNCLWEELRCEGLR